MATYYSRYLAGECEPVYHELLSLGEVSSADLLADMESVAAVLVERSFHNLKLLFTRLVDLGYAFQSIGDALVEATHSDVESLATLERQMGAFPCVIRKWYERVGSVDFSQDPTQLFSHGSLPCVAVSGLGMNTPLVYCSLDKCVSLRDRLVADAESDGLSTTDLKQFLPLGGWASNSEPKGVPLPCKRFDCSIFDEGSGGVRFVEELRSAFKWGGFPFWRRLLTGNKQAFPVRCVPSFRDLLPHLTQGMLPI